MKFVNTSSQSLLLLLHGSRVFISGPMTGKRNYNYERFRTVARLLERCEAYPLNPACFMSGCTTYPKQVYMRSDIQMLLQAEMVVVLEGWEKSEGAKLEVEIARQLNLPFINEKQLTKAISNDKPTNATCKKCTTIYPIEL